jgi:hypothetical protein
MGRTENVMGDMVLKNVDEAVRIELERLGRARGVSAEQYAADLIRQAVAVRRADRTAVARAILASQAHPAKTSSAVFIREDRDRE